MEAIAELIGAFVIAFVHALAGLLWGIGALLAAVVEFLFLALTQGLSSASQKYKQRKTERKSRLTATESEADTEATGRIPSISRKQSAVIAALVIFVVVSGTAVVVIRDRIRKQRIAATRIQVAELADSFADQIKDEEAVDPEPGKLSEYDAWKQPLELFVDKALLGSLIVVRSPGPDRKSGSVDDILAVRVVRASAKEVGGELANRALDAMRDRVEQLFPGDDGEAQPEDIDMGGPEVMSLRTDRVSGIITWVFGLVMIGFATFGILIIVIQRAMIGAMPPMPMNPNEPGVSVIDAIYAVHGIWFIFLPLMIAGGIVFAFAGFRLQRGSTAARRLAQANAVCGYVWIVAYMFSCIHVLEVIGPPPGMVSGYLGSVFQFLSIGVGGLMLAAFPTGLLFVLSRPGNRHAKPQSDTGDAM